ncbi:MAG TPA: DUF4260 domain-containing protein [Saprospiraceae bacterium]|nr:DUF4260 domain-containing protein [Saprospiraceae bacterium]
MKKILNLEEVAVLLLSIFLFSKLSFDWWWFPSLIFLPDIGMIGYLINPKIGAYTYNLLHHRGLAALFAVVGIQQLDENWLLASIILFAHISLDRMLGYGLKHTDSFHNTHLGFIGKNKSL